MSLLRSFVLMECAVSIVDTSSDHSTSTVKWTRTPPISRWPATALTISSHPRIESTISGTVPNGCRPNVVTSTKTTTSRLVSPDARGRPQNRVASHARPSINEHPACSKLSGVETGLLGCARKPTTVSVQLTSAQLKASANVTTSSTKTPFSPCSRIAAAVVALIVVFVCIIRR